MFKLEFGDPLSNDEHTAIEDAYSRLLKARKWLYLVSLVAALHAHNAISYSSLATGTKSVVQLTAGLAQTGLVVTLAPLVIQYLLLVVQLITSYRVIISERLLKKVQEAFARAQSNIQSAAAALQTLHTTHAAEEMLLAEKRAKYPHVHAELQVAQAEAGSIEIDTGHPEYGLRVDRLAKARADMSRVMADITGQASHNERRKEEIAAAEAKYEQERANFQELRRNTPQATPLFLGTEICLDAIRILLPLVVSVYALGSMVLPSIVDDVQKQTPPSVARPDV